MHLLPHRRRRARALRADQTDAEMALWRAVRDRRFEGYKFRRQHPVGPYIADFACVEHALIVEVDGSQHLETQAGYDRVRDAFLREEGFRVLRFTNLDVLRELDGVATRILQALREQAGE